MIDISITDLACINNIAKLLKVRNFMWYRDLIIGVDNFDYIIYGIIEKDANAPSAFPTTGLIMNQRELSAFVKSFTTESSFQIDDSQNVKHNMISTISDSMVISTNIYTQTNVFNGLNNVGEINNIMSSNNVQEKDVSDIFRELYGMTKTAGAKRFDYDKTHSLTMFGGIIPLSKSDKLYLSIVDNNDNTFYARFKVNKKIVTIYVHMKFINIYGNS